MGKLNRPLLVSMKLPAAILRYRLVLTDTITLQNRAAVQGPLTAASKQIRSYAADAKASPTEVSSILEQRIRGVQEEAGLAETGRVLSVGYANND